MLVLASLPLPIADVETDLDRAGYPLVAEWWYLHHQGILVGKQQREGGQDPHRPGMPCTEALVSIQTTISGHPEGLGW